MNHHPDDEITWGRDIDVPVQLNYEYCKGCGQQGLDCVKPHRFFTFEGWVSIVLKLCQDPPWDEQKTKEAALYAEEFFPGGFDTGEIGRCIVCRRTDCARPHRKYTREGYAKFQIEVYGVPREEAMKRANEEFRAFGGDWAWYPQNPRAEFGPPKPYNTPTQATAPSPPPEGWPKVNDEIYVRIMKAIRQAWADESARWSGEALLHLRDEFDQRWCDMTGEETPTFSMPWDDLPRAQPEVDGTGSHGRYEASEGAFPPQGAGYGGTSGPQYAGGYPGQAGPAYQGGGNHTGGQQGGAQPGDPFAAYSGIPGMPNVSVGGSGGAGFTFTHHQGDQSQTYEYPADSGPPREAAQSSNQKQPPSPQNESSGAGTDAQQAEQKPQDQLDIHFTESVKWYAETFLEKTKGQSKEITRIWKEALRKRFCNTWGALADTVQMPWDQDPDAAGAGESFSKGPKEKGSRAGNMDGYNTSRGFDRAAPTGDAKSTGHTEGYDESSSSNEKAFDERFRQWKDSESHGKNDRGEASGTTHGGISDERTRKTQDSKPHEKYSGNKDFSNSYVDAFDERFQKWKKSGAPDEDNEFNKRFSRSQDGAPQSDPDTVDDYGSDASIGPSTPKAPRGAGVQDYEDVRRHFEEIWDKKSHGKRGSELKEARKVIEYSWLMRTGNDSKGELMPWHSKYRKYVRRPSGSRSSAEPEEANMSNKHSRPYSSKPKMSQDTSGPDQNRGAYKPYTHHSKEERAYDELSKWDQQYEEHKTKCSIDWDTAREKISGSSPELKKLAQIQQVKFECTTDDERAKTEVMPWTRYVQSHKHKFEGRPSKTDSSASDSFKPSSPKCDREADTEKPTQPTTKPIKPCPPLFDMDAKYETHKVEHRREWQSASKNNKSDAALKRLAQVQQVKFERTIEDKRAKTEIMPWTKYIHGEDNGAREPPKPSNPSPPKDDTPDRDAGHLPKKAAAGSIGKAPVVLDKYEKTRKEFSKEWERLRATRMMTGSQIPFKKLAQQHQDRFENAIHDERTRTDTLPWTKYIHEAIEVQSDPFNISKDKPKKTRPTNTNSEEPAKKSAVPFEQAPLSNGDGSYGKYKADFVKEWADLCKTTSSSAALTKQAQILQVKFEGITQDDRARTEVMPWSKFIRVKPSTAAKESQPSSKGTNRPHVSTQSSANPEPQNKAAIHELVEQKAASAAVDANLQRYERLITRYKMEWENLCERSPGVSRRELAKKIQRSFEKKAADGRATTEDMPWSPLLQARTTASVPAPAPAPIISKESDAPRKPTYGPSLESEEKYAKLKADCMNKWNGDSSTITSPAALQILARSHQVKFEHWDEGERSTSDEMPWTKYLRARPTTKQETQELPKNVMPKQEPSARPKDQSTQVGHPPELSVDQKYANHKAVFVEEWQGLSERTNSPVTLRKLAQTLQLKFKHMTEDERANTEVMPWSRYLESKTAADRATRPSPLVRDGPPKQLSDASPSRPSLPKANTNGRGDVQSPKQSSHRSFKKDPAKQPTVETMPPSTGRYNSSDATSDTATTVLESTKEMAREDSVEPPATATQPPPAVSGIQYEVLKDGFAMQWYSQKAKHAGGDYSDAATAIQTHFENSSQNLRSKIDVMPWTKYLKISVAAQLDTVDSADAGPRKQDSSNPVREPSRQSIAKQDPLASVPGAPQHATKLPARPRIQKSLWRRQKEKYEMKWLLLLENRRGSELYVPAQNIQKAFEKETADERAKTEIFPWTEYLRNETIVESTINELLENHPVDDSDDLLEYLSKEGNTTAGSAYENQRARFELTWDLAKDKYDEDYYEDVAQAMQISFEKAARDERAKTELMSWTMYLPVGFGLDAPREPGRQNAGSTKMAATQYTVTNAASHLEEPQVPDSAFQPEENKSAARKPVAIGRYEKHRTRFAAKWDSLCENRSGEPRSILAKRIQKAFEGRTADSRAWTEVMPWTKYLDRNEVVEDTVYESPKHKPAPDPIPSQSATSASRQSQQSDAAPGQPSATFARKPTWQEPLVHEKPSSRHQTQQPDQIGRRSPQLSAYQKQLASFVEDWTRLNDKYPTADIHTLAETIQRDFEKAVEDDRAKMEKMPWTRFLPDWHLRVPANEAYDMRPIKAQPRYPVEHHAPSDKAEGLHNDQAEVPPVELRLSAAEYEAQCLPAWYPEYKESAAADWGVDCLQVEGNDYSELARYYQDTFESGFSDPRVKDIVMPWTVYLPTTSISDHHDKTVTPATVNQQGASKSASAQRRPALVPTDDNLPGRSPIPRPLAVHAQDAARNAHYEECKRKVLDLWSREHYKPNKEFKHLMRAAVELQLKFEVESGDERAQTEQMPWTAEFFPERKTVPVLGKTHVEGEETYEERIERYKNNWVCILEVTGAKTLPDAARYVQRKWVHSEDDRAKDERMPWQTYLTSDKSAQSEYVVQELPELKSMVLSGAKKSAAADDKKNKSDPAKGMKLVPCQQKEQARPPTNINSEVSDAQYKLHYDHAVKHWNNNMLDKPFDVKITQATHSRKVWLDQVGTRAHEDRMPWDNVLAISKHRNSDADFDLLSVRHGRHRFDSIRDRAGEDEEGVDWGQLAEDKEAVELAEREREAESERKREEESERKREEESERKREEESERKREEESERKREEESERRREEESERKMEELCERWRFLESERKRRQNRGCGQQ